MKRKRYPDSRIQKYKARLCVTGQQYGLSLGYEETFAPVVQWSSERMMLTLMMKLGLWTKQVAYSNALVQADIDGDVYYELPTEFLLADGRKSEYVLEKKKSSVQSQHGSKPTKSGEEKSPVLGHSVPALAPEGDYLPSPMPT